MYKFLHAFNCRNTTKYRLPDEVIAVSSIDDLSYWKTPSPSDPGQAAAAFFVSLLSGTTDYQDYLADYLTGFDEQSLAELASKYGSLENWTLYVANTGPIKLKIRQDIPCSTYIQITVDGLSIENAVTVIRTKDGRCVISDIPTE